MKKLFFNLEVIDGYPPVSMESVWAEVTEESYFKINNIQSASPRKPIVCKANKSEASRIFEVA